MKTQLSELIQLSHEIGREDRHLAMLGEGNTSVKLSPTQFAVKASGTCLATLTEADVTLCDTAKIFSMLEGQSLTDQAIETGLMEARVDPKAKKPSVEAMFHAWLLTLEGVNFVGHCHPITVNQILCSPRAQDFAKRRLETDLSNLVDTGCR